MARQSTTQPALPVLLTRPEAQSHQFAAALMALFADRLRPVLTPLMAPVFLAPTLPEGPFAGVIFTSATAVMAASRLALPNRAWPGRAWCVGAQTAARAREAGFQATSADGDAAALVAAVLAAPPTGRLLHLRGEEARGDIADTLTAAGVAAFSAVIYRQDPQPLTAEALALLAGTGPVIVPLFSPRTAALFGAAVPVGHRAPLWLAGMSMAVADRVPGLADRLEIARRPDADAMLEAVGRLLEMRPAP